MVLLQWKEYTRQNGLEWTPFMESMGAQVAEDLCKQVWGPLSQPSGRLVPGV